MQGHSPSHSSIMVLPTVKSGPPGEGSHLFSHLSSLFLPCWYLLCLIPTGYDYAIASRAGKAVRASRIQAQPHN